MGNEGTYLALGLKVWTAQIERADKLFGSLSSEDVLREIAPGRNRQFYLWWHLTAIHDAILPLLGLRDRLHPEFDVASGANSDKSRADIPGGTEGIGFATGKLFVKEGAYVFITGRRQKELDEAVKAIGTNVSGVQGDVAQLADLDRLYETVAKVKGRIDIVFTNAGVGEFVPFGAVTEEHFDKLFNINVRGTLFTVQKALPLLNDGGSIILNGSVASVKGTAAFGVYAASKAAIRYEPGLQI